MVEKQNNDQEKQDNQLQDSLSKDPADSGADKSTTPESPVEEKDKETQPKEPQVSLPKDHGAYKYDKVEPHEAPASEQSPQDPDNPPDILRRDLKRIKSAVDDSLNRIGKKLSDLLDLDDEDQNKKSEQLYD